MIAAVIVGLVLVAFSLERTSSPNSTGGIWFPTDIPNCLVWNPTPQLEQTATWSGDCLNGKAHGLGNTIWRSKSSGKWVEDYYTGVRKQGKQDGYGTYFLFDGSWVSGTWNNGQLIETTAGSGN